MSGGSLDYAYNRVWSIAAAVKTKARTPLHRAFAEHLNLISTALRDLEWMLSDDTAEGSEIDAIRAVLPEAAELEAATKMANEALANLQAVLERTGDNDGE